MADLIESLETIKNNPQLKEIFDDQLKKWYGTEFKGNFDILFPILKQHLNIDETNNMFFNIMNQIEKLIDYPDKLVEYINSQLKPKDLEKKEFGEVFTPLEIINEMLDKLDHYYKAENSGTSIFSNPNMTWFDPANGIGNFPVCVYTRLMEGLKPVIKNVEKRKKHIIENMLYMSEINPKNVFICKKIFQSEKYRVNIHLGDTLKLNPGEEWGIDSFDVIMGNPPFNKGGIRSHTGKYLGEKNETIWPEFIKYSLQYLIPNGYLVFINPLSWLKKSHSVHNLLLEKHIIWLKLWDYAKSLATINGKIPVSLYVLQNKDNINKNKTQIITEIQEKKIITTSNVYLDKEYSIPLAFHTIFNKLTKFIEQNNCRLEIKTKTIKSIGEKQKLPSKYTLQDMWAVDTYTIKDGIMVKRAIEQHPDANKTKLIIANKGSFNGTFIDEGKLSLTGSDKLYILGNNLELIKKILSFKIGNIISHYTKYRQNFLEKEAFIFVPDIRKLGINDITEDDFYTLIELTQEEINQIKSIKQMNS